MDAPIEPRSCSGPFSTAADDGYHYMWGRRGSRLGSNIIAVYDPRTELWSLLPTTGPLPPGELDGRSVSVGRYLFTFGGHDESSYFNDVYKLDLDTLQWTKVQSSGSSPVKKIACGLVRVNERTLCCFGGYGIEGPTQPGSTFTRDTNGRGWTNEFQFFNVKNGNAIPDLSGFCKILATGLNRHCNDFHIWKSTADYSTCILSTCICSIQGYMIIPLWLQFPPPSPLKFAFIQVLSLRLSVHRQGIEITVDLFF